jgi:hypothetical protein
VLQYSVEHTVSWFPTIATLPGKRTEEFITPDLAARFVGYQHPTTTPESVCNSPARSRAFTAV